MNEFLSEEDEIEEARAKAIKDAVAFQVQKAMTTEKISKVEMARRMKVMGVFRRPGALAPRHAGKAMSVSALLVSMLMRCWEESGSG